MPGCAASAAPASRPSPVTMLSAPSGKPDARGELGDAQQRQARVLGGLHDAGVAGRERAADRAPEDLHRIVPRDDVAGDAVRLAPRQHRVARADTESSRRAACRTRRRRTRSSARTRRRRRAPASSACRSRAPRSARARRRGRESRARASREAGPSRPARAAPRRRRARAAPPRRRDRCPVPFPRRSPRTAVRRTDRSSAASSPRRRRDPAIADEMLRAACAVIRQTADAERSSLRSAMLRSFTVASPARTSTRACSRRCAART